MAVILCDKDGVDAGKLVEVGQTRLLSQDQRGFGVNFHIGQAFAHHRGADDIGVRWRAGSGVDQVMGRFACMQPAAIDPTGRGYGLVGQSQDGDVPFGRQGVCHRDQPRSVGRLPYTGDIAPRIHQARPPHAQTVGRLLDGPALGDPAQI